MALGTHAAIDFPPPEPAGQTKAAVFKIAEAFAAEVGFVPGDRIEPLVGRLGGTVEYLSSLEGLDPVDGSLVVYGPNKFVISVATFTGAERNRFTIAHELGHYVLHSGRGQRRIKAARFGSHRAEWEANWFAAAFLMPGADFKTTYKRHDGDLEAVAARYLVSSKAAEVRRDALGIR